MLRSRSESSFLAPKGGYIESIDAHTRLRLRAVIERCGISKAQIYRLIKAGKFPAPQHDGPHCARWLAKDIAQWLDDKANAPADPGGSERIESVFRSGSEASPTDRTEQLGITSEAVRLVLFDVLSQAVTSPRRRGRPTLLEAAVKEQLVVLHAAAQAMRFGDEQDRTGGAK